MGLFDSIFGGGGGGADAAMQAAGIQAAAANRAADLQYQMYQEGVARQQMQQQQSYQDALQQYGKTQDPDVFNKVDPQMALDIKAKIAKLDPPEVTRYEKLTGLMENAGPFLSPQTWPAFKKMAVNSGLAKPDELPDTVDAPTLQKLAYGKEIIKAQIAKMKAVPRAVGGMIYDSATDRWLEPPMSAAKERELGLKERGVAARERAVGVQEFKATQPPQAKPVSPTTLKHQVTGEVDKTFKWNDVSTDYESRAKQEIMAGQKGVATGYFIDTPDVPYEKLPEKDQTALLLKNAPKIKQRARELFEKDRQARIDREYKARKGETTSTPSGYSMAQLQSAYDGKAAEIAAMPDGPNKQAAMQQLEKWKNTHLVASGGVGGGGGGEEDDED